MIQTSVGCCVLCLKSSLINRFVALTSNGTVGVADGGNLGCYEVAPNFPNFFAIFYSAGTLAV